MVLGGIACLLVGLVLGLRSIFVIQGSQGRLRGYPPAIAAIVVSFVMLVVAPMYWITKRETADFETPSIPERRSRAPRHGGSTVSRGYAKLVAEMPPREWFKGAMSTRRIRGEAMAGEGGVDDRDTPVIDRIVERVGTEQFTSDHIIELTLRNLREKGTDVPVVIWFAEVDDDPDQLQPDFENRMSGQCIMKRGRIYMGVYTERTGAGGEFVDRLADHYTKRLKAIELD